jgi:hypothetical protein
VVLGEAGIEPDNKNTGKTTSPSDGGQNMASLPTDLFMTFADLLRNEYGFTEHELVSILEAVERTGITVTERC